MKQASYFGIFALREYNYRADIDGLRAIAVMSVLLHHAVPSIFGGGFVGVDIFFVISGYLITLQLKRNFDLGNFSLLEFYKRRINRIVPALFTVTFCSLLFGFMLVSPADFIRLASSASLAMLGVSNIYFGHEYGSYFSPEGSEAPLLHTWSLGVEEQFYLLWPVFLVCILRNCRKHTFFYLLLATVLAILISELALGIAASAAYYLIPARAFELMIGALLSLRPTHSSSFSQACRTTSCISGILMLGGSIFLLTKQSAFPGVNALWPCIGSALIIWAGAGPNPASNLLRVKPLVFLGLISYSLYLWHWPIIAYCNYLNISLGLESIVVILTASIAVSSLTWKYIEKPLRLSGSGQSFATVITFRFLLPAGLILVVGGLVIHSHGFPGRFPRKVQELEQVTLKHPDELRADCHVPTALYRTPPLEKCRLGKLSGPANAILIGDSFANHFTGMIDELAKASGWAIQDYTMAGCPPILGFDTGKTKGYVENCSSRNNFAYSYIESKNYRLVILAASWPTDIATVATTSASLARLISQGRIVVLIAPNARIPKANSCPVRQLMYESGNSCTVPNEYPTEYLARLKLDNPEIHIIYPNNVICSGGSCHPLLDGIPLYMDASHLNDIGSRLIGKKLLAAGVSLPTFQP